MAHVTLDEAGERISELIRQARLDEEIIITDNERTVVRLTLIPHSDRKPRRGSAKGLILHMDENFDEPLEDFCEYME